jgi:hypothetical protein
VAEKQPPHLRLHTGRTKRLLRALLQVLVVADVQRRDVALDARQAGALAEDAGEGLAVLEQRALAVVERDELQRVDAVEEQRRAALPGERFLGVFLFDAKEKEENQASAIFGS